MPDSSVKTKKKHSGKPLYVSIALPLPLRQTFIYSIPDVLQDEIKIGSRLIVPFGQRQLTGYAVSLSESLNPDLGIEQSAVKDVIELLDHEPLLTREIIDLTKWTSDYYAASWGEVLKASLPGGINAAIEHLVTLTASGRTEFNKNESKKTIKLRLLHHIGEGQEISVKQLKNEFGVSKTQRNLNELLKLGWISKTQKTFTIKAKPKFQKAVKLLDETGIESSGKPVTAKQQIVLDALAASGGEAILKDLTEVTGVGTSPIKTLEKRGSLKIFSKEVSRDPFSESDLPKPQELKLNLEQEKALEKLSRAIRKDNYEAFLLHGVTGSGKTEVYIRAMKTALELGKSSLMLVPEIALTPVFSKRLRAVFGKEVAILHSSLSMGERFDEWRRIHSGEARIAIGTRSAVFAPLKHIGLVVVDEEHDTSYRQHEMPFYHGRDVAIVRANFAGAVVVLGSATPALETFHNSQKGKYTYLQLEKRIGDRPLAKAELIDMREVFEEHGKDSVFSPKLLDAIKKTHEKKQQSIILLNRRGFSQFVLCRSCGETIRCKNCDITLTFHKRDRLLICHYCNHREKEPAKCPSCESEFLFFLGEGTQKIEKFLNTEFPDLRIERVDRDSTRKRKQLENTLAKFSRGEIDMLIGTQMLAKGHDFPNVTLVGVISVDTGLSMPDFRASERTFQLLTQVAGRAGRGDLPGRVLIQTYYPEHYALKLAKTQDYLAFYDQEIMFREKYNFPPFVSLASILIKHPNYNYALDQANAYLIALNSSKAAKNCIIMGPAPAALPRLKGEYRLQILIKSRNRKTLRQVLNEASIEAEKKSCDTKIIYVEIDPINML